MSRNPCDTSGDPARTVPEKRRVPKKSREKSKHKSSTDQMSTQEKIKGKLKMLKITAEDTEKILETEDVKAIKRHGSTLESIIDKTHQLKLQVQE